MYCLLCVYGGELSNVYANVGAPPLFSYYTPKRRHGNNRALAWLAVQDLRTRYNVLLACVCVGGES
jgi:hypothetical protein